MRNRLDQSAPFSASSTADLLANQLENHHMNAVDGEAVERKAPCLEKQLGLMGSVSLIVGTMIGSGIFASASGVFTQAGSAGLSLIVWAGCGVIAMLGALCYVELGTAIPKSGGEFMYLLEAFGGLGAFLYSWTSVTLLRPAQTAIITLAFGQYVAEPFFPSCVSQDPDRQDLNILVKLLAALCIGKGLCAVRMFFLGIQVISDEKFFPTSEMMIDQDWTGGGGREAVEQSGLTETGLTEHPVPGKDRRRKYLSCSGLCDMTKPMTHFLNISGTSNLGLKLRDKCVDDCFDFPLAKVRTIHCSVCLINDARTNYFV